MHHTAHRVALLWLFFRVVSAFVMSDLGIPFPGSMAGPPITALILTSAIILALWVEMRRRSELVFLANLGHSFRRISALVAAECLVLEVAVRLAVV